MSYHYCEQDLIAGLTHVGVEVGDILFCHSNIGFFGRLKEASTSDKTIQSILRAFFEVLGATGTLVVPCFTYSFSRDLPFNPDLTPTDCGIFSESLRHHVDAVRSHDPNISVVAIGAKADMLTTHLPENSYGEDSFFDRFFKHNGKILNLNFDAGSTFIHFVERKLKVPYRFDKKFQGVFEHKGIVESRNSTLFVRDISSDNTIAEFTSFDMLARQNNLFRTHPVGRGFVGMISAHDTFELINRTLPKSPWFLTKAHLTDNSPTL
jgi:aminoglycoside 3-N-acetyltransferase